VQTEVIPASAERIPTRVDRAPHFASLSDRFELQGHGFCGDADKKCCPVNGHPALVIASSSESLAVVPPADLDPGPAEVSVSCNNGEAAGARAVFLELSLEADTSALKPEKNAQCPFASPEPPSASRWKRETSRPKSPRSTAEIPRGPLPPAARKISPLLPLTGKQHGNILVSIRLLPRVVRAQP
jgi:hypothetical protein